MTCMAQYACDSLIENGASRIIYLNVWSEVGTTVWKGLGSMDFWKCVMGGRPEGFKSPCCYP